MNEPGYLQQVGIEGTSARIFHTCICGACQGQHVTLDTPSHWGARRDLHVIHGWKSWPEYGWVCPACNNFLLSVHGKKT